MQGITRNPCFVSSKTMHSATDILIIIKQRREHEHEHERGKNNIFHKRVLENSPEFKCGSGGGV